MSVQYGCEQLYVAIGIDLPRTTLKVTLNFLASAHRQRPLQKVPDCIPARTSRSCMIATRLAFSAPHRDSYSLLS
jgi:hypothetical protein